MVKVVGRVDGESGGGWVGAMLNDERKKGKKTGLW